MICTLTISIAAGVVSSVIAYYVCKWLDRKFGG